MNNMQISVCVVITIPPHYNGVVWLELSYILLIPEMGRVLKG